LIYILTLIKGGLVGIANIIPGVSGGTFALILGIYEKLLAAIGNFGTGTAKSIFSVILDPKNQNKRRLFKQEMQRIDLGWLLLLAIGAVLAILLSSHLIAYLLDNHLSATLAFFVGLIVPSIIVPYRLLNQRGIKELLSVLIGCGFLILLTVVLKPTAQSSSGLLSLFFAGAIAVSAMILPGVSGSFVLMLMGEYRAVLEAINNMDFIKLFVFAMGCIVGLLAFVRLLNYLLKKYHSLTISFLIGLILGSLWVLWPFKEIPNGAKITAGQNIWPAVFDRQVSFAVLALIIGLLCSFGLNLLGKTSAKK